MIERQLRSRGVRNEAVLGALATIPRERFVSQNRGPLAYADEALPIEAGQTISQPYIVARMTELLDPHAGMRVLEIGTGSGYQACVLATIGCEVISIERHADLAAAARFRIQPVIHDLGIAGSVTVVVGDGTLGYPERAPYEGIIVAAAAPSVPDALRSQLSDGGRLVIPVGNRSEQQLTLVVRRGTTFESWLEGACVFVPLVGAQGFSS